MSLVVHQSIAIYHLKVDSVANSSILQIGCAGTMKSITQLFNTGGYLGPAPEPGKPFKPMGVHPVVVPLASIR